MNPTTNNNSQTVQNEVIDLRELFSILKRRKKLIGSVTVILTILTIVYAFIIAKPIYEVKSNIMVGFIGEDTKDKSAHIANPSVIVKTLNIVFNIEDKPKTKKEFVSEISSITLNKKLQNFITIKTEAISNEEALKKNKEAVQYLKDLYQPKLDQFIINTKNKIKNIKQDIINIDDFEIKNIKQKIKLLKTQKIARINEKIDFYTRTELPSIKKKINFYTQKLNEYTKAVENLYHDAYKQKDNTAQVISSMQMLNYQNMILNAQNKIEDLNIKVETINTDKIINLQREKKNVNSETIRKLEYEINISLTRKKIMLKEKIQQLIYSMSSQNIQNSKVIGEYIIKESPIKPKKKLIVIVAFITGLMLSVFLAFFLEFLTGIRREKETQEE